MQKPQTTAYGIRPDYFGKTNMHHIERCL